MSLSIVSISRTVTTHIVTVRTVLWQTADRDQQLSARHLATPLTVTKWNSIHISYNTFVQPFCNYRSHISLPIIILKIQIGLRVYHAFTRVSSSYRKISQLVLLCYFFANHALITLPITGWMNDVVEEIHIIPFFYERKIYFTFCQLKVIFKEPSTNCNLHAICLINY